MKYLLTIMIISALSCKKDDVNNTVSSTPPSVTKIETSSEVASGAARPKFTITLSVPDTAAVKELMIYVYSSFPNSTPVRLAGPKTGTYDLIDVNNTYPPPSKKYFSIYAMKDGSFINNGTFDVN
jgi:hypothetical protein